MAIESLSILTETGEGKAYLAEQYGKFIPNVFSRCLSAELKNSDLSGDIRSGTMNARKFNNATIEDYGAEASKIKSQNVAINIDQHKQLLSRVSNFDTVAFGVEGLVEKVLANKQRVAVKQLEKDFWAAAYQGGKFIETSSTTLANKIDDMIVDLEDYHDKNVDGVDRDDMVLVLSPKFYTSLQDHIDTLPGAGGTSYQVFHNIAVRSSTDLAKGCDATLLVRGSIAQPVLFTPDEAGKYPATNDYHFGLFLDYGTKATSPELIRYLGTKYSAEAVAASVEADD